MTLDIKQITDQLLDAYHLENPICKDLGTPTNDVIKVVTPNGDFALKLYTTTPSAEIQWEIDLLLHLLDHDVPVVHPIKGKKEYLNMFIVDGEKRIGVMYEWAAGEKPKDSRETYVLIGEAAAQIHQAADTFASPLHHTKYDADLLINEQLERMRPLLVESGQLQRVVDLSERLRNIINNPLLDYGVCHMDLKPDNIHIDGDKLTIFDFNSSGESWRAIEPYRVLKLSENYFKAWLEGYRSVRPFNEADEKAVAAFGIIGDIRSVVWDLGLAISSRSEPLLHANDLPKVVDGWLEWERRHNND
ncbi:MAG TPA: phosphotransferase [Candidatus Saccharimonadales bacterium]|nr:phosphotransferase [Candidatus Saccharimonadales bacterium]